VQTKTSALNMLKGQIAALEQKIEGNETVKLLWEKLQSLNQEDREKLRADLERMYSWFPVKRLAMQMIFLLPLFAAFYAWNNASIRRNRGIQTLVSSHLLVVAFIPILFRIMDTVYNIIPKKLLKKIIGLLESLKLVAIWHYLVIAAAIAFALFVIYIFQKKLFSREKMIERRISKGQCQQCGKHLPAGSHACPFCGFIQVKACGNCGRPTHVFAKFCRECGQTQELR
jgi:RNA polymerase subunit RPABC4/transcription elongation factor Spt4